MAELKKIHEAILIGDLQTSVNVTKEALEEGTDPQHYQGIYDSGHG